MKDREGPGGSSKDASGAVRPDARDLWPKEWSSPSALAGTGCAGAFLGFPSLLFGFVGALAALAGGRPSYLLPTSLVLGGAGGAMGLLSLLLFRGPGGSAEPKLVTIRDGGTRWTGVGLPYSRARVVGGIIAGGCTCLAGVGMLMGAGVGLSWWGAVFGLASLLAGTVGVMALLSQGAGRGWQLVLLPDGVLHVKGRRRTFIAWDQIWKVSAGKGPGAVGVPMLELLFDDWVIDARPPVPRHWRLPRGDGRLNVGVWRLAVDPALVYAALEYYTTHPEARAELDGDRAVRRLLRRALR
jgi:hypothetical protein